MPSPSTSLSPEAATAGMTQPILAGVLAAVVGYASTFTLVLAAYAAMGASAGQAASGLFAVCVALGVLNIVAAWMLRIPVSFAWSTPAAAFLLTSQPPAGGFAEMVGAYLMVAALIVLTGLIRPLGAAIAAIPGPVANAMLAGILLSLCIAPVQAVEAMPLHTLPMIGVWVLGLIFARRYAVPLAVLATVAVLAVTVDFPAGQFALSFPELSIESPIFTLDSLLRLTLPVYVVTMAGQNLPGVAVLRANGFRLMPGPSFVATGIASAVIAPMGGHTLNLAAVSAALSASPEAHPDPARRWVAPVATGVTYLVFALMAGLAAAFIAAAPPLMIQAVAGLALMPSLASALAGGLAQDEARLPAVVTFVTAASGIVIFGLGGAFWGLVAGLALSMALKPRTG